MGRTMTRHMTRKDYLSVRERLSERAGREVVVSKSDLLGTLNALGVLPWNVDDRVIGVLVDSGWVDGRADSGALT